MFKGYKTIAFNALAVLVPILELTELKVLVPDEYTPIYLLVVALGNIWLRSITTTPVGRKA